VDVPPDLIERLQNKDPGAYQEFMTRFGRRLLNFGVRMCGDREDAKEVVQDTLLKTFQSVHELKSREAFAGWLYRIATNACLMRRRKSQFLKEEISLDEAMPDRAALAASLPWNSLPDQAAMNAEVREQIRRAVLALPEGYKSVLVLRDMEGLDTEEVAQALGLSKDVVKMRLHRARAKVRNELEAYLRDRPPEPPRAP
jgi:RNA polymerase sigma-70 factor (ECF subfamily)